MLDLKTAYLSNPGGRTRNEDACGYWSDDHCGCWVVSDGAGGHGSGDIASRIVVSTVLQRFTSQPQVSVDYAEFLLRDANNAVLEAKRSGVTQDNMHATATLLLIDIERGEAVWAHVGDTRIYLFREGRIVHRSRDHSLVQNLIDAGYGDEALIRGHPQRSFLTSAIGSEGEIELAVAGQPVALQDGDVFLICSDGFWEYVDETQMLAARSQAEAPQQWLEAMAAQLNATVTGENDNYTGMSIYVHFTHEPTTVIRPGTAEAATDCSVQGDTP